MDFSIILSESAIFFQVLLIMLYFKKEQFNDSRAKLFKGLLLITILYTIIQVIYVLTFKYGGNDFLIYLLWKIDWILVIAWWTIIYLYCFLVSRNVSFNNIMDIIKYDIYRKIFAIFIALITIATICLPKSDYYDNINYFDLSYLPGKLVYIVPIIAIIIIGFFISTIVKNRQNLDTSSKTSLYFVVFSTILCFIIQAVFDKISFIPLFLSTDIFIIYSLLENPDIKFMNEINEAQGDIEKSNRTKTDFLSNMTSEIKVPMNLIMTICDELIGIPSFDEKIIREDISQIVSSGNSLIEIINNILDVSKIESGKILIQERDYKINDLLTDVLNIAKSKIGNKQVKLNIDIDQNVSSVLNGDYSKIYQVLVNVLTNAIKYTDVGMVNFSLTSTKVGNNEKLLFKVSDTGIGIKDDEKSKIFSKGFRSEYSIYDDIDSGGLGLVISKQYVESLNGKIWFESQFRVGTTFYVDVSQKIVDSTPISNTISEQVRLGSEELLDCSKFKALIVDDNLLNIKVAKRLLEKYGLQIESVTSGKECVYKIKEGNQYDIIFVDHMMPEIDGIETLHILRKLDGYNIPPIIALTANAVNGMKEMYMNEGFNDYLSKPINTNELDRIINLFLSGK